MAKCKTCGAEIRWIKMTSGEMMPVNAEPVTFNVAPPGAKGADLFVQENGRLARGIFKVAGEYTGYISHFATCPAAAQYRDGIRPEESY